MVAVGPALMEGDPLRTGLRSARPDAYTVRKLFERFLRTGERLIDTEKAAEASKERIQAFFLQHILFYFAQVIDHKLGGLLQRSRNPPKVLCAHHVMPERPSATKATSLGYKTPLLQGNRPAEPCAAGRRGRGVSRDERTGGIERR